MCYLQKFQNKFNEDYLKKKARSESLRAHVHLPLGFYRQTNVLVYKEHNKPNEKKKHQLWGTEVTEIRSLKKKNTAYYLFSFLQISSVPGFAGCISLRDHRKRQEIQKLLQARNTSPRFFVQNHSVYFHKLLVLGSQVAPSTFIRTKTRPKLFPNLFLFLTSQ